MVFDAVRSSLNLLSGVTDATRAKATEAAAGLMAMVEASPAGGVASQVSALADELFAASSANREQIVAMLQKEVEAAVGRAIAAVSAEVATTSARVADVQRELNQLRGMVGLGGVRRGGGHESSKSSSEHPPTEAMAALAALAESEVTDEPTSARPKRSSVRRAPRPSTQPGTPSAELPGAPTEVPVKPAPAKRTTAKRTTAKRTTAKRTTAKRTTAKKTTAKKSVPPTATPPVAAPPAADVEADA